MRTPILAFALLAAPAMHAQSAQGTTPRPVPQIAPSGAPELSPAMVELLTLDGEFSQSVAKGGGAAFTEWFAEDAVTLSNGKDPVLGKAGIALSAHWKPAEYKLQWIPMGAQMGPSGDMGFTWGHYDATTYHPGAGPTVQSGRYVTVWKRLPNGKWKVALDASADEPKLSPKP